MKILWRLWCAVNSHLTQSFELITGRFHLLDIYLLCINCTLFCLPPSLLSNASNPGK